jgi:hypothetical protein
MVFIMKNLTAKTRRFKGRAARSVAAFGAGASALLTQAAFAVDDSVVTAAQTAGESSVLNATNGLLGIIAVIVGISLVLSIMKRA